MFKKMTRKTWIFIIFLMIGIVLFGLSVYDSGITNIIDVLKKFSLIKFLFLVTISFLNFYLYSLRWELIVKALFKEKKIPSSSFFWDRMAGSAISYVTPVAMLGGEPLRVMLIEEEGVPNKVAVSSTIIDKALEISTLIVFISLGIVVTLFDAHIDNTTKTVLGSGGLFLLLMVFWFYYSSIKNYGFFSSLMRFFRLHKLKRLEKMGHQLDAFEKEMNQFYKKNPRTLWALGAVSLLTILFLLAEHFLVAWFMGVRLTMMQVFMVSTIPYFSYLMPIPGGLGLLEGSTATLFALMGVSINSFAYIFIIRLRDFIFVALGLIRGWHKGYKVLRKELDKDFKPLENKN